MTNDALSALLAALEDARAAIELAHPELPLPEFLPPADLPTLLADAVLLFIDNLQAATKRYRREVALTQLSPPN